jgi:hypothetical protein
VQFVNSSCWCSVACPLPFTTATFLCTSNVPNQTVVHILRSKTLKCGQFNGMSRPCMRTSSQYRDSMALAPSAESQPPRFCVKSRRTSHWTGKSFASSLHSWSPVSNGSQRLRRGRQVWIWACMRSTVTLHPLRVEVDRARIVIGSRDRPAVHERTARRVFSRFMQILRLETVDALPPPRQRSRGLFSGVGNA